jgi:prepilin-type N-terminal cleavage/methylation domain-containing protein
MKQYPRGRKAEKGFTLLEIIVVLGILGILASIAIPTFSSWLPDYRLKRAVQDLYSNMQLTKMEAIKSGDDRSIIFNPGGDQYTKSDGAVVRLSDYGPSISYGKGDASQGVGGESFGNFVTYSTPDDEVSFNSRGMGNNAAAGYVYFTNVKGTVYAVGSLPSGVVQLKKWNGSDWD